MKSEKENYTWGGVVLNGSYTKPAHYYTYWDSDIYYNGRLHPWNTTYTDYTLSTTHRTWDYTDSVRIQCNALNAGMIAGYEDTYGEGTGYIELERHYNALKINPNGGTWRGNSTPTTISIENGVAETIGDPIPPTGASVTLYYHDDDNKVVVNEVRKNFTGWTHTGGGIFDSSTKKFTSSDGAASLKANYSGGTVTLPVLSREHYTFVGWDTNPDMDPNEESADYLPGASVPVNADMELHAIWKVNFELEAYIERVLSPHDPVFENGEMGNLKISTVGFVDKVEVTFPYEMSRYDDTLSMTHVLTPKLVDELVQEFYIPLYSAEGGYRVTVTAYNEEGESLTVYPNLSIAGSILDDFRTRIR